MALSTSSSYQCARVSTPVAQPAIYARVYHAIRNRLETDQQRLTRLTRISPVGKSPFTVQTVFKTRATPDVCDFNMHLSNSSYAMTYDMARFKYVVEHLPLLYGDGGWIAVGGRAGTYYSFVREIPLNAAYEIRLSMASWDHKWVYMVARYVTYTSNSKKALKSSEECNGTTSSFPDTTLLVRSSSQSPAPEAVPSWIGTPLPEGAVLHCTAISRLCSKIGRITIPPSVILGTAGFGISQERFDEIQSWRFTNKGKCIKNFYAGGWKEVPEHERWWEDALGGDIEARRVQGLRCLPESIGIPVVG
ncbi:hypothetical protein BU17DRAFT_102269 [Hysterangium stoloniferum]|nr:hypothetical protein BU17DRAFT_102269 [Hysterangium stoloniferum]